MTILPTIPPESRTHLAENDVDIEKERTSLSAWLEIDSARETFTTPTRREQASGPRRSQAK
ncbi:MAG: hypothetical protein MUE50_12270 [Pirellulaceae bacterium]|jgi:hypothetical protein|nr:hypothetical protein [Pirellulaceae bacterium]